jgi:hypothetical protein
MNTHGRGVEKEKMWYTTCYCGILDSRGYNQVNYMLLLELVFKASEGLQSNPGPLPCVIT